MNKSIIITGGNGQDAQILARKIKNFKVNILINKKLTSSFKKKYITYAKIDLKNYNQVCEQIKKIDPYAIIHLASKNRTANNKKLSFNIHYKNNLLMTKNLLKAMIFLNKKIKFIFAGSSQMFKKKTGIVNERSIFEADCHYSKYKIDSHKLIINYKKKFKLNATTAILFNHDSIFRDKKFLFPRIISYLKKNNSKKLNEIYKSNIRGDFSHADDICNGLLQIINLKKLPDKIILSSFKYTYINDLLNFGISKFKIDNNFSGSNKKKTNLILGNNSFAKKILKWKIKKNSLFAFKEILKNS